MNKYNGLPSLPTVAYLYTSNIIYKQDTTQVFYRYVPQKGYMRLVPSPYTCYSIQEKLALVEISPPTPPSGYNHLNYFSKGTYKHIV